MCVVVCGWVGVVGRIGWLVGVGRCGLGFGCSQSTLEVLTYSYVPYFLPLRPCLLWVCRMPGFLVVDWIWVFVVLYI